MKYYYVRTYLPAWEEMIVSHETDSPPELLVWEDGISGPPSNHTLYAIEYTKIRGEWVEVNVNYHTYLPSNLLIVIEELLYTAEGSNYPPGFHMKQNKIYLYKIKGGLLASLFFCPSGLFKKVLIKVFLEF